MVLDLGFGNLDVGCLVLGFGFGELPFQDLGHCAGRLEASQLESRSCFEVAIITFLFGTRQLSYTLGLA